VSADEESLLISEEEHIIRTHIELPKFVVSLPATISVDTTQLCASLQASLIAVPPVHRVEVLLNGNPLTPKDTCSVMLRANQVLESRPRPR
jgi:hypothetical protein